MTRKEKQYYNFCWYEVDGKIVNPMFTREFTKFYKNRKRPNGELKYTHVERIIEL